VSGFIAINRNITPEARSYIFKRKNIKIRIILSSISLFLILKFSISVASGIILIIFFTALLILRKIEAEKNEKYYNLLKTGVLAKVCLKYISSKNATVKPGRVNMRYFYELRYYDLKESVFVSRFTFVNKLDIKKYSNIPMVFSAANPKKAVIFHKKFNTSKNKMKGYLKETRLKITENTVDIC
jgi:hypothetical protein